MSVCVIGAGILGLAMARELARRHPGLPVTVLDKETGWRGPPDRAQQRRRPRRHLLRAGLAQGAPVPRGGVRLLKEYCAEHGLPYDECGKLVVAIAGRAEPPRCAGSPTGPARNGVPGLAELDARGPARDRAARRRRRRAALAAHRDRRLPRRRRAARRRRRGRRRRGAARRSAVAGVRETAAASRCPAPSGPTAPSTAAVVCAGLDSDRVARHRAPARRATSRIVPFRGEYWRLRPEQRRPASAA